MWIKSLKRMGSVVLLAGCSTAPYSQVSHDVEVSRYTNDFFLQREVATWSIQSFADLSGNRWPIGLTLSAKIVRYSDGPIQRYLILRKEEISPHEAPAVYEHVQHDRERLAQTCQSITLVRDGGTLVLPVSSIIVRALMNEDRMPVVTDHIPDPVEVMVGKNPPGEIVLSTVVQVRVEQHVLARLASAQNLAYDFCGEAGTARAAELEGLQEVVRQEGFVEADASIDTQTL